MASYMELELANACYKLMHDLIQVKKGERRTDYSRFKNRIWVVEEMAKAAGSAGSKNNGCLAFHPEGIWSIDNALSSGSLDCLCG